MRLWVMSDLHVILTRGWDLAPPAERPEFHVLIMAGELIPRAERGVRWLEERVPDKPAIYVLGNHEAYGADEARTVEKAMDAARGTKIYVLQNCAIPFGRNVRRSDVVDRLYAAGRHVRAMAIADKRMNDFKKIRTDRHKRPFRPANALFRHRQSRAFLEAEMGKSRGDRKLVIVTHHAPVPDAQHSRDYAQLTDEEILAAAYRSDLTALMGPQSIERKENAAAGRCLDLRPYPRMLRKNFGMTRVVSNAKGRGP
ncbi:metallophosphoesterase [Bradyrhizobium japonicum]|uniref:metallophosphoesterase n=1 Tax=Bradyrhizobium japonicum TaxID=375 RepID=UPI0009B6EA76|nr:metallophosphoesterase [Bradyrhizobium japonicum]